MGLPGGFGLPGAYLRTRAAPTIGVCGFPCSWTFPSNTGRFLEKQLRADGWLSITIHQAAVEILIRKRKSNYKTGTERGRGSGTERAGARRRRGKAAGHADGSDPGGPQRAPGLRSPVWMRWRARRPADLIPHCGGQGALGAQNSHQDLEHPEAAPDLSLRGSAGKGVQGEFRLCGTSGDGVGSPRSSLLPHAACSSCSREMGSSLSLAHSFQGFPFLACWPSLLSLQMSLQLPKKMGRLWSKDTSGGGSQWESRGPGDRYLVPELACVLWLQEPKSWNLLVGRKVLYQKHIGRRRSCALPR